MRFSRTLFIPALVMLVTGCNQPAETNYDESAIPDYTLPEILVTSGGDSVTNYDEWKRVRRPEILALFEQEVYGAYPAIDYSIAFSEKVLSDSFLHGKAVMKEIESVVTTVNGKDTFTILYIYPKDTRKVPVFTGLNFSGNHTIDSMPLITIHSEWVRNSEAKHITGNQANPSSRGTAASRWPLSLLIENGYGVATAYYGEFDPDYDDGFKNGFHPLFAPEETGRDMHSPGSITIWAKGMSLIADYLLEDTIADPTRLIAIGHSRLGKTALWCGANDERFAAVISNNSGCGGAALSMRAYGETVGTINETFPHWFNDRFNRYNNRENRLPVDQHMLLGLVAPRPLYVASATQDQWADPRGEYLALKAAVPVYNLFGFEQDFPAELPEADKPYQGITAYHLRSGNHDITRYDWLMYIRWCDRWLVQ